jgi:cytochrome c biogenesis protein CcmG, thiol:disulfide interchange protein DsbE
MSSNSQYEGQTKRSISPWTILALALALAAFSVAFFMTRPTSTTQHPAVGLPAPNLDLVQLIAASTPDASAESLEGTASLAGKPAAGKVTVLHFWGTWCPPCLAEYPHLVEMIKQREANPKLQFVSVSCESGPGETFTGIQQKTRKYYEKIGAVGLPTFVDASGNTRQAVTQAIGKGSMAYPTTVIIDPAQRIAGVWQGYSEASLLEMESLIDRLLESRS